MPRPEKTQAVDDYKQLLQEAKTVFVTDYTGLNVEEITKLRKNLRDNSVRYLVAKNTLLRIAAKDTDFEPLLDYLKGQTALALAQEDPAVAAKILYDSFKDIEKPEIRAFVLDGQFFAGKEITRLAELPSREILLAQIIAGVEAPIAAVISSIDAMFQELLATLEALKLSKEGS
jgi:large subunit ribosomal protein L10